MLEKKKAKRCYWFDSTQLLKLLDTICFTLGFAPTIASARQLVTHGHITINGEVLNIPSFQCRINDIVGIKRNQLQKI